MKISTILLAVTAIAFAGALGGAMMLIGQYAPGASPLDLVFDAGIIGVMVNMLVLMLIVAIVITGLAGGAGAARMPLALLAFACVGLSALGALYNWNFIQMAVRATNTTNFAVVAPSYAEVLMSLALGLFGALLAQGFRARPAKAATAAAA